MIRSRMRRGVLVALTATSLALVVAPAAANAAPSSVDLSTARAGGPVTPNAWGLYGIFGSKSYCEDIGGYGQEVGHWSDWFCYPASTNSFWLYVNWR